MAAEGESKSIKALVLTALCLVIGLPSTVASTAETASPNGGEDAASPAPKKVWSGAFDASASVNGGNTETSMLALRLKAERRTKANLMLLEGSYDYGEESGANNLRKAMLKDRLEWTPNVIFPWAECKGEHDLFGGIDLRLTLSAGAGAHLVKKDDVTLSFRLGLGYINENAVVAADDKESMIITAHLDFSRKYAPATTFELKIGWENELGPWRLKAEMGFRHNLTNSLSFRISAIDAYDSSPPTGKLGNDYSILIGLGYTF